ncbi:MAG: c-type cytochrome biogenesis protein CcmI [Jannaschia sp.]
MLFWIAATALVLICIAAMLPALTTPPPADDSPDVAVYRDQLAELDRDAERGVLLPEEAEASRAEVARRLLSADRAAQAHISGWRGSGFVGAALIALVVAGITAAAYLRIGAPGYGDMPLAARIEAVESARAARPSQAVAEAEVPDRIDDTRPDITRMAAQLSEVLVERPDDLRGWRLAVQTESGLGDLEAAWRAQDRVVAILGAESADAEEFALLAELMILAANGYVSPEAEQAIAAALDRDPSNGTARYFAGLMYAQGGRPDLAWPIWRRLVGESEPNAPWLPPIYAQIEQVASAAGDPTSMDQLPRPRGPSAEDIEAAGDMSLDERMEMIGGMVQGLSQRLASDGGPASDWARLIIAYGVLGRLDDAAAIYAEARQVFASDPAALDTLARAAERAGIAP